MTVSTRPLTPWGNTSPPVFLLTMIRGSRLHHTHSFGFAVSTMEKVKEDVWCLVRKGEVGSGWEGRKKRVQRREAAQHGRAQIRMREWIAQDMGWEETDTLKQRLNREGRYAGLLNEEPAGAKKQGGLELG